MDGKQIRASVTDKPIAKPRFPLPAVFTRSRRGELPTRPRPTGEKIERAHFYRKETSASGSPVYSFYITREDVVREVRRD